jgi:hypothetical protein
LSRHTGRWVGSVSEALAGGRDIAESLLSVDTFHGVSLVNLGLLGCALGILLISM